MIDVGSPGFGIDITAARFSFDGETLSAACKEMDYSSKTDEEIIHLQGEQDPAERTAGQTSYEGSITWATRQWLRFCARFGGEAVVRNKEFTLVVNGSPQNDPAEYEFTFYKFRMHSFAGNFSKSAAETKVSCSFLKFEQEVIQDSDAQAVTG